MKSVYSAVRTGSLNEAVCAPSFKGTYSMKLASSSVKLACSQLFSIELFFPFIVPHYAVAYIYSTISLLKAIRTNTKAQANYSSWKQETGNKSF
jgi:hypothetical protein